MTDTDWDEWFASGEYPRAPERPERSNEGADSTASVDPTGPADRDP